MQSTTESSSTPAGSGTVSLGDEEAVKRVLVDSVLGLWEVVNNLTRLKPTRRERFRVTIFGSARAQPGTFVYEEVKRVSTALTEMGCEILTGGGPGLMQAANEGAAGVDGGTGHSVGIRVDLPFEQEVNPFVSQMFEHKTFFTRLHHFVLASDAFIVVPGGIGTVLEMLMVWQLLQVKHVEGAPLICVGKMWEELVVWATKHMVDGQIALASAEDMRVPVCLRSADEAIALIAEHHKQWVEKQGAMSSRNL
jgi:uncharacterized protein (TIGR00730 family)